MHEKEQISEYIDEKIKMHAYMYAKEEINKYIDKKVTASVEERINTVIQEAEAKRHREIVQLEKKHLRVTLGIGIITIIISIITVLLMMDFDILPTPAIEHPQPTTASSYGSYFDEPSFEYGQSYDPTNPTEIATTQPPATGFPPGSPEIRPGSPTDPQPPTTEPQTTPTRVGTVTVRYIANGMYISNDSIQNANVYSGGYVNAGGVYIASYVTINANLYSDGYVRFRHPPIEPEGKALRFVAWLRNNNPNTRSYLSNLVTLYWGNSTEDSEIVFYPYMVHDPSR